MPVQGPLTQDGDRRATLSPGMRFGVDQVVSLLGTGGMGEVYRARDTRLNRTVALKLLSSGAAADPVRRKRFKSEARAISQLNHPYICTLYDVGEAEGVDPHAIDAPASTPVPYLVMECLEGETLADRLTRGRIPLDQALQYAIQIADALDAAHRRGVVHRDLKPSNIMLTKAGAKLLDFGIARMTGERGQEQITVATTLTAMGALLGTKPYMAPEQLEGQEADQRSDLFAFGALFYEMLTGRRAFPGSSESAVIAAILDSEPAPISAAQPLVPAALEHFVMTCLAKNADDRWQSAADVRRQLEWIAATDPAAPHPSSGSRSRRAPWLWPSAVAVCVLTTASLAVTLLRDSPADVPRVRFPLALPNNAPSFNPPFALSPDGRSVAFIVSTDVASTDLRLWVHSLESGESRMLSPAGMVGQYRPSGRRTAGSLLSTLRVPLEKIPLDGGSAQTVVTEGNVLAWSPDDVILFGRRGAIMRVPGSGGTPALVIAVDPARNDVAHYTAHFLPDGRHFLYLRVSPTEEATGIYIGAVDVLPHQQDSRRLLPIRGRAVVRPFGRSLEWPRAVQPRGYVDGPTVRRPPAGAAWRWDRNCGTGGSERNASPRGPLLCLRDRRACVSAGGIRCWHARMVGRDGAELLPVVGTPSRQPTQVRLSPDGSRLAVIDAGDVWVYDVGGRPPIKLTSNGGNDMPLWSADGQRIIYATLQPTRMLSVHADDRCRAGACFAGRPLSSARLVAGWARSDRRSQHQPVDGVGHREDSDSGKQRATAFRAIVGRRGHTRRGGVARWSWLVPRRMSPARTRSGYARSPGLARRRASPQTAELIPGGRGTAANSISSRGNKRLMSVSVDSGAAFNFTRPALLFESGYLHGQFPNQSYDVAAGGRFVMIRPALPRAASSRLTMILNWRSSLTE